MQRLKYWLCHALAYLISYLVKKKRYLKPWAVQRGDLGYRPPPPGKSQVAIGFLKNSGMDPSRGKSIRPSVKDIDNFNP